MLEETINQDLKKALLSGDKTLVTTLRGLKSSILYAKIASNSRDQNMADNVLVALLQKEAKKRQESADLYKQGGNADRAEAELQEKRVIEAYLPPQLTDQELGTLVDEAIAELGGKDQAQMGAVIGKIKQTTSGSADGAAIARLVREKLQK